MVFHSRAAKVRRGPLPLPAVRLPYLVSALRLLPDCNNSRDFLRLALLQHQTLFRKVLTGIVQQHRAIRLQLLCLVLELATQLLRLLDPGLYGHIDSVIPVLVQGIQLLVDSALCLLTHRCCFGRRLEDRRHRLHRGNEVFAPIDSYTFSLVHL